MLWLLLTTSAFAADHPFWDNSNRAAFAISGTFKLADGMQTCHALSQGRHEDWMPTQSCRGIFVLGVGAQAGQTGVAYWLHRKGHHRLERLLPYLFTAGNVAGIAYSYRH